MLSILDLNKATEGYSRPIVEGEAYYNSGLLFGVGLVEKKGTLLTCQGLAVQTSATTAEPYEINIVFDTKSDPGSRIKSLVCSCIAGQSSKCKHAVATVLWFTRHNEDDLSDLSCTDVEQQWGKLKTTDKPVFEGCLIAELCHVKEKKGPEIPEVPEEMREKWKAILLKSCPLSEYSIFFSGLRQCYGQPASELDAASRRCELDLTVRKLLSRQLSPLVASIAALAEEELRKCDASVIKFYKNRVALNFDACVKVCVETLEQSKSSQWQISREVRVSGARVYNLYTYFSNKKADWDKKYESVYSSTFSGNANTVYGLTSEDSSRDLYSEQFKCSILETGTVIRPELPFLCFSPDGVICDASTGDMHFLFETKAPIEGKRFTANELIENHFVKSLDVNGNVKEKHAWYGQIQLGMLLLGFDCGKLVIYSSLEDKDKDIVPSIYPIDVHFNETFVLNMCSTICKVYFRELLPRMMQKPSDES